jgi:hypothetical protein
VRAPFYFTNAMLVRIFSSLQTGRFAMDFVPSEFCDYPVLVYIAPWNYSGSEVVRHV